MINFLKRHCALLPAVVLCLSLTACGSKVPNTLENIALDDTLKYNYDNYLGIWYAEDSTDIRVSQDLNGVYFELYDANSNQTAGGKLQYVEEYSCVYVYDEWTGIAHKCWIDYKSFSSEDDILRIDSFGKFRRASVGGP